MTKSGTEAPLGICRSAAVISLGVVALAGSIASRLARRVLTPSAKTELHISKMATDEWESDLARLNLPSRREVEVLQQQMAELETQLDQLLQARINSQEGAQEHTL